MFVIRVVMMLIVTGERFLTSPVQARKLFGEDSLREGFGDESEMWNDAYFDRIFGGYNNPMGDPPAVEKEENNPEEEKPEVKPEPKVEATKPEEKSEPKPEVAAVQDEKIDEKIDAKIEEKLAEKLDEDDDESDDDAEESDKEEEEPRKLRPRSQRRANLRQDSYHSRIIRNPQYFSNYHYVRAAATTTTTEDDEDCDDSTTELPESTEYTEYESGSDDDSSSGVSRNIRGFGYLPEILTASCFVSLVI